MLSWFNAFKLFILMSYSAYKFTAHPRVLITPPLKSIKKWQPSSTPSNDRRSGALFFILRDMAANVSPSEIHGKGC